MEHDRAPHPSRVWRTAALCAIAINVVVNTVRQRSEREVGTVSEETEPLLSAAGWAFSIWGVIFAWTLAYGVWQLLPRARTTATPERIAPFVIVNALGSAAWTVVFTAERFVLAWLVMLAILASLIVVERRTYGVTGAAHVMARAPFTLNLGWICVATILNTAQLFALLTAPGALGSPVAWSAACIAIAGLLGAALVVVRHARWAGAAIAWGLAGVAAEMHAKDQDALARLAVACCALVCAALLTALVSWRRARVAHRAGDARG